MDSKFDPKLYPSLIEGRRFGRVFEVTVDAKYLLTSLHRLIGERDSKRTLSFWEEAFLSEHRPLRELVQKIDPDYEKSIRTCVSRFATFMTREHFERFKQIADEEYSEADLAAAATSGDVELVRFIGEQLEKKGSTAHIS